jgi:iron complex transport system substrate-binding protein
MNARWSSVVGRWALALSERSESKGLVAGAGARLAAGARSLEPGAFVDRAALILALAAVSCLLACGAPSRDRDADRSRPPTRIISLVPAATEMLFAMGAGPRVIAVSSFDHYPHPVEMLPRVGALLDPDIERIITLRPDLVVLFEGQVELREKLAQAGIRVFVYPRPTLADIVTTLRSLGRQVGLGERADREADAIESQLDAVRQKVKGLPPPRTMLVIGREPGTLRNIFVSGGLGFLSDALTIAGGANVFGSVRRENLQVTTEAILASQPDVIVEVVASQPWRAADIERETHVWDTLPSLPAVRNHRVYLLMGDEFVTPGPRIVRGARELSDVLHGTHATTR